MAHKARLILPLALLSGCITVEQPSIAYTAACPAEDQTCQRNMNAQTLYLIGEKDAAVELVCLDKELSQLSSLCVSEQSP